LIAAAALLVAAQAIRNAAVAEWADFQPTRAAKLWRGHPAVELSLGMTEIARAARQQKTASADVFAMIGDAAAKAPLAPEPFLVRGVREQLSGDSAAAERDFLAAQWRDPRSLPAAYFLADYYFHKGAALKGLNQIAVLARLTPAGLQSIGPYTAAFAENRANWPLLRTIFRDHSELEDVTLDTLARDSSNAGAALALADSAHRQPESPWVHTLLAGLVDTRQYARARAIWASVSRVPLRQDLLVYDTEFADSKPPPPFNWTLTSSTVGLAERQSGGRLHALFYGQEDGVLASELVLLPPGSYRLTVQLLGDASHARSLSWSIRCDKTPEPFATVTLDAAAARGWSFQVPANCPAQWLELTGASSDMPQQSDVTIRALRISRGPGA
jgi:hypothetical protein